jgi:transposase
MVMDMWNPYRQVGKKVFPGRLIVADRFHVVRMANEGLERVRKQIRKTVDDKTRIKLKDERFLLLKRRDNLKEEDVEKVEAWFSMFPQLKVAYETKERFFDIYCQPTRKVAELFAEKWVSRLDPAIEKQFRDLRVALNNWHEEIFNYYENPVTNGYTESMNNITRFINRMGRGYSFEVLRARLLFDEKVIKGERAPIRKKPRKTKPESDFNMYISNKLMIFGSESKSKIEEGSVINYGADLSTLAHLLEEGYFL